MIVRGVTDFANVRSDLIDLVGQDNFAFKSTINSLNILSNNPSVYRHNNPLSKREQGQISYLLTPRREIFLHRSEKSPTQHYGS
jgi:hypothetical protein